jgi:hypothetical protein
MHCEKTVVGRSVSVLIVALGCLLFPDATAAQDTVTPLFSGGVTVSGATSNSLTVSWAAAADNVTPAGALVYQVCRSTTPSGCSPNFVAHASPAPGVTTAVLSGLTPSTTYFIRIRVVDQAGNFTINSTAINATTVATADGVAPTFSNGVVTVSGITATSVTVSWTAASDNVSPASALVYQVCRSTTSTGCSTGFVAAATTAPGATTAILSGLTASTTYYV